MENLAEIERKIEENLKFIEGTEGSQKFNYLTAHLDQ
jgi:hypothetical protein